MGVLIMKDYLAIIRKLDFIDLFKYGHFTISYAVPFDGNISAHADDMDLFDMLTSRMNMYEYSFEYLIIHFNADDYNDSVGEFDVSVFYLSHEYYNGKYDIISDLGYYSTRKSAEDSLSRYLIENEYNNDSGI